jgi:class 3 adenylate cyclase
MTTGDGFHAAFATASQAVEAAVARGAAMPYDELVRYALDELDELDDARAQPHPTDT